MSFLKTRCVCKTPCPRKRTMFGYFWSKNREMLSFYVKFWTDRPDEQTERQTDGHRLNDMPPIFRCAGIKTKDKVDQNNNASDLDLYCPFKQ